MANVVSVNLCYALHNIGHYETTTYIAVPAPITERDFFPLYVWLRIGLVVDSFEHYNESYGSTKGGEFLD